MISKTEESSTFINNLNTLSKAPGWLMDIREAGISKFNELGIPTVKDEEWKYTNLASLAKRKFSLIAEDVKLNTGKLQEYCSPAETNIVFVNGRYANELSNTQGLPDGIRFQTLSEAMFENSDAFQKMLSGIPDRTETPFISLNKALTASGLVITVDEKTVFEKLIHIVHITQANQKDCVVAPRVLIHIGKSCEATILESHICFDDKSDYLSVPLTDITLDENAVLHYVKSESESNASTHIGNTRVWQERNSNFDGFSFMNGSALIRNDLDITVNGEGSNSNLHGLYFVKGTQHVDNHTLVEHKVPNCTSNQLYKGILTGKGRAVFNGKIFVRAIAQQTNSYQLNKNLLMGTDCRIDTKPQLEINADDVKCTHGATVGQLNEDELFYLQARAIPRKEAVKMLSRGFVADIFDHIQNESICQKLNKLIEPNLAAL